MFSLVQFRRPAETAVEVGVYDGHAVRALGDKASGLDLMAILESWATWTRYLIELDTAGLDTVAGATIIAPLTFPRKVLCAGSNYYDHAAEMNVDPPDPDDEPFFFLKTPTTTVIGPFDDIHISPDPDDCFDWEAELGVVISRRARDVPVAEALALVAGYVVANDISARGRFRRPAAEPFNWNWLGQKNQDDSCPLGPGIVPAWQISNPQNLEMILAVNGVVKQKSNTSAMVIGIARLISGASRMTTLEPGDVILTGTPAGVGLPRKEFLHPGDVVTVEIESIGRITNRIAVRTSPSDHPGKGLK